MTTQMAATQLPAPIQRAGLCWAVKSTFSTYVESMSDGEITVLDGAERLPDGAFFFPLQDAHDGDEGRVATFAGTVQFTGHRGMLAVAIGGIRLIDDGKHASLSIADSLMPEGRLTLVELSAREQSGDALRYPAPRLTEDGSDLFFENYPAGAEFEPIWFLAAN
ncbi:HtaA domain-containing protein [Gulosibacter molinativorax]|uniref:Htaa domain-containing protein n=1 Tax=Gulosibacter molinativorax TaxID=256821 RepID=A0ABT7C3D1_9MICO|nr:HtaA domain-containing protein [Gulosibacter molinativorax]MDJ1369783.1 hypothetical protein [Gulosibacter molinativorax]QUY61748.1 Hypotetical protein [Gulosibacter molinativorax]